MIYFHKILPLIASPLFLIIFLIIIGIIFRSNRITLSSAVILIIFSLPIISNKLIGYLERDYVIQDISTIDKADAIVVLSGMVKTIKVNDELNYEFNDSVDRILSGIDLFKNNKASLLILTKGQLPWSLGIPEGEYLKNFAINFGVPEQNILLTNNVQNTDQEAKSIKKLLNSNEASIILVTSAFHMPRAKKVFQAYNIKVTPFAVDFKNSYKKIGFMDFLPSAASFNKSSFVIRELIGRFYYHLKY
jgi:uncharacterized SAM-binding protein YcdF (DUF218 family)